MSLTGRMSRPTGRLACPADRISTRNYDMCCLPGPGWGPVPVGARSGLGPIWALMGPYMGPYGPIWAHVGPYGPSWTGLGEGVNFPSTFRKTIWTNFPRFGFKTELLMKFLNDSASFLLAKLKNQVILTKNPNISPTILKIPENP